MTIKPVLVPDHDAASLRKLMDSFAEAATGPTRQQLTESRAAVAAAQGITEARNTYTVVFVDPSVGPEQIGTFDNAAEAKKLIRDSFNDNHDTGDRLRNVAPGIYVLEADYRNTGEQATADNYKHMYHWIIQKSSGVTEDARQKLNFDEVYGRYLKVTDNDGDPNKEGFSLVTPLNGASWNWRERPEFKKIVQQKLNEPGFLGDHKYQQIIDAMSGKKFDSARHLAKSVTEARNTYTVVFVDPSDAPKQIGTFDNAAEAKQLIKNSYREMYDTGDHLRNVAPGIYVLEEDYRNTGEQATADNYKHMYHWIIQKSSGVTEAKEKTPGVALSKAYKKDFDGKKPGQGQPETALTGAYSATGKPGGALKKKNVSEGFMDTVKQAFNDCVVGYPQGTSEGQFIQGWARAIRAETGRDIPLEKLAKLYQDYVERSDEIMQSHGTTNEGEHEHDHDEEGETCPECDGAGCPECYGDEDRDRAHDHAQGMERESAGMAEAKPDVMRHAGDKTIKVVKRGGRPIGEIGIDAEASEGNGSYYVKLYDGSYDAVGFDTAEEALAELKAAISEGITETADVKYGVFAKGGSVGSQRFRDDPVKTFDTKKEAIIDARRRRSGLSKGERGYYGMGYVVKPIRGDVEEGMIDNIKNTVRAANYDRLARRSNSQAVAGGGFAPPAQFKSLSAKGDQRAQKAQDIRKGDVAEGYDADGAYDKWDPKHPDFVKNFRKFQASNPGATLKDFIADLKKGVTESIDPVEQLRADIRRFSL